jgi:nitrite reductase/ring-hydroxylating ferredoxin subunit
MKHREFMFADATELKDGEMRQVTANGMDILLARIDGKYYAVGATRPHYGVPQFMV